MASDRCLCLRNAQEVTKYHQSRSSSFPLDIGLLDLCPGIAFAESSFEKTLLPYLQTHCIRCHCGQKQEGDFRIDNLSRDVGLKNTSRWAEIIERFNSGEMLTHIEKYMTAAEAVLAEEYPDKRVEYRDLSTRAVNMRPGQHPENQRSPRRCRIQWRADSARMRHDARRFLSDKNRSVLSGQLAVCPTSDGRILLRPRMIDRCLSVPRPRKLVQRRPPFFRQCKPKIHTPHETTQHHASETCFPPAPRLHSAFAYRWSTQPIPRLRKTGPPDHTGHSDYPLRANATHVG